MRVRTALTWGAVALSALLAGCGGEAGTAVAGPGATSQVDPGTTGSPAGRPDPGVTESPAPDQPGSTDGAAGGGASETDSEGGSASESAAPAPEPVTRQVDKTGWYGGFAITVGEVVAEPSPTGDYASVTATLVLENLTDDNNYSEQPNVTADGLTIDSYLEQAEVPGGGKAETKLTFGLSPADPDTPIDVDAALDAVAIGWGTPEDNQTIIPLAADAEVDSVEPVTLDVSGTMTQDQINVEVTGRTLTPSYEAGEKGKALLTVHIAVTCGSKCSDYGYNVNQPEFSVTTPDGESVVADQRSGYCCTALYPGTTDDNANNTLVFVVPMPGTGDYTLTYENPRLKDEGAKPATLEFTV